MAPDCIAQLKKELVPIKTDKDKALSALKNLNNSDLKIAKDSYDYLGFYSPRLALTDEEMLEANSGEEYAARLCFLLCGNSTFMTSISQQSSIAIHDDTIEYGYWNGSKNAVAQFWYPKISVMTTQRWARQRLGIILLERLGTPEAKTILEDLTKGDPRILPTKDAVEALARLKSK